MAERRKDSLVEWDLELLSDRLLDEIDAIAVKHNVPDLVMHDAIRAWFGDDMLATYIEWRAEGDV